MHEVNVSKGKWILKKGTRTALGLKGNPDEVSFAVNPQRVTVTPRLRIVIDDTLGGRAISPWIDPESGSNIGSIEIRMEGSKPIFFAGENSEGVNRLMRLYEMSMGAFLAKDNNVLKQEVWQLTFSTPVFANRKTDRQGDMIVLLGYMTQPMVVNETADNPWYPSWSLVFSVWGGDLQNFREVIGVR